MTPVDVKPHVDSRHPDRQWHLTAEQRARLASSAVDQAEGVVPAEVEPFLRWVDPPGTSRSPGVKGMKARDAGYLYICVEPNHWKRAALEDSF